MDDENSLAAVRGIAAGAKRVVSQSAIATLEKVDLKELAETDRSKQLFPFRLAFWTRLYGGVKSVLAAHEYSSLPLGFERCRLEDSVSSKARWNFRRLSHA